MNRIRRTRPAASWPAKDIPRLDRERNSSDLVAKVIEEIKAESGRNAKHAILKALRDSSDIALKVMMAVFDVNVTYGIKKVPALRLSPGRTGRGREFDDNTWGILDDLASRKLTGNRAQDVIAVELGFLTPESRNLFTAILQQNLRAGFSADVVNDIWGPVLKVVKIQLANNYFLKNKAGESGPRKVNPKARFPAWHDVKYDGVRGERLSDEDFGFFSRKGLHLEVPPSLHTLIGEFLEEYKEWYAGLSDCGDDIEVLLDCEIVPLSGGFKDVMSQVRASKRGAEEGTTGIRVIDILTKAEYEAGKSDFDQRVRRTCLERMVQQDWFAKYAGFIKLTEGREIHDEQGAAEFYAEVLLNGGEGTMHKHWEDYWENKRTDGWLKLKPAEETEGEIVGYKEGAKHSKWEGFLGAVLVKIEGDVVVSVDGMTDAVRTYIHNHRKELLGETAELLYHEKTPDGSLRHPRFKPGFIRDDK
jgi:DNA ligase-1